MDIYLSPPCVDEAERAAVMRAFDSNWITPLGPEVDEFERELGNYVGMPGVAALSSGTAAIHLALRLSGVGPGDHVAAQSFTFAATVNPILYQGAIPVFIDSEASSWNLDPELLEKALVEHDRMGMRIKAVIAVDIYGVPARYAELHTLCTRFGAVLIEDATEGLGTVADGTHLGAFADFSALSFNGNKIITTSGGGAFMSRDPEMAKRARFLASQAKDPAIYYQHSEYGYNYRLSNLLAAMGRAQLAKLEQFILRRRQIFDRYHASLGQFEGISFMEERPGTRLNRWLSIVRIDPSRARGTDWMKIRNALFAQKIESRPLWKPLHCQPVFESCRFYGSGVAEQLFAEGLCLPSGSNLTDSQQERICSIIERTLSE